MKYTSKCWNHPHFDDLCPLLYTLLGVKLRPDMPIAISHLSSCTHSRAYRYWHTSRNHEVDFLGWGAVKEMVKTKQKNMFSWAIIVGVSEAKCLYMQFPWAKLGHEEFQI